MLAIRLQRTGRKGHAQFRVIVQDSRKSPTSGRVVAYLGSYNPHTKTAVLKKEEAQKFLDNGAQPSDRVVKLLKAEGVKLPKWVQESKSLERKTRNPEKLRKNQPEAPKEEVTEAPAEEAPEATAEEPTKEESPAEEAKAPEAEPAAAEATEAPKEDAPA